MGLTGVLKALVRGRRARGDAAWAVDDVRGGYCVGGRLIRREDVVSIVAFKRDLWSVDQVCVGILVGAADGEGEPDGPFVTEDDPAFAAVLADLGAHFRLRERWREEVVHPPFATNRTVLWRRDVVRRGGAGRGGAGRAAGRARRERAMHDDTRAYNEAQGPEERAICGLLAEHIDRGLPEAENRIWHGHPVWFLDGNPVVGYSRLKGCVRLLFWSGRSFAEPGLAKEGSFQAAEVRYTAADQVDTARLARWLAESRDVQWDYRNLARRKGRLERLR